MNFFHPASPQKKTKSKMKAKSTMEQGGDPEMNKRLRVGRRKKEIYPK